MQKIVRQREGWKKQPEGKLLINVDGSFREWRKAAVEQAWLVEIQMDHL